MTVVRSRTAALCAVLALVFAAILQAPRVRAQEPATSGADVNRGIVQIFVVSLDENNKLKGVSGTGFVINDKGVVITNRHVIKDALVPDQARIFVNPDGQLMNLFDDTLHHPNAEVIWSSDSLDLAILQTNGLHNIAPIPVTTSLPRVGDQVLAIGYPGAADREDFTGTDIKSIATVTSGVFSRKILSSWSPGSRPLQIIQHSAAISWGNSGGPLLDACRRVIGVNTQLSLKGKSFVPDASGNLTEGATQAEGIQYASAISELLEILHERDIPVTTLSDAPCVGGAVQVQNSVTLPLIGTKAPESVQSAASSVGGFTNLMILVGCGILLLLAVVAGLLFFRRPTTYVVSQPQSDNRGTREKTRAIRGPTIAVGTGGTAGIPVVELAADGGDVLVRILPNDFLRGPVVIGRSPPVERFALTDNSVSREHFSLEFADGKLYARDLNSLNGTFIDGKRLDPSERVEVSAGQTIMAGSLTLRVRFT